MTVSITVRNLPEEVRDEFVGRAERAGLTVQEYLLRTLQEIVDTPDISVASARISREE